MKKTVLAAINAKYFHSNLAVKCLKAAAGDKFDIQTAEYTINDSNDYIIQHIAEFSPSALGFSCYIWNIEKVIAICDSIKKIFPECFIFLGGPEVSYNSLELLEKNSCIDMIIRGEGEIVFSEWINLFENGKDFSGLHGTTIRKDGQIIHNENCNIKFDLNSLPFLYSNLEQYDNKIIYFETSRGCPYKCSYCMSSILEDMTFLDEQKAYEAFEYFIYNNVKQVKLVDRTFNYPVGRAKEIFKSLIEIAGKYPDSKTNFHFEITGELIDEEMLNILKSAPNGLIQFEIGVQSTNLRTLQAINRHQNSEKLVEIIKEILQPSNIDVYLDLIAGLPYESYERFACSFNDVYGLNPDKLHLGFLKVLKGSQMERKANEYGIVYSATAPYKVLKTNDISYAQLARLDKIEQLVETYKNSGNFESIVEYAACSFNSPFEFFERFSLYLDDKYFYNKPQKLSAQYDLLYEFLLGNKNSDMESVRKKMLIDWVLIEKPRRYPEHIATEYTDEQKTIIRDFCKDEEKIRKYLSEYVDYPASTIHRMCHFVFVESALLLFDYKKDKRSRIQTIEIDCN